LSEQNIEVLLDDRDERPGVMFADAELIGIPHRVVISDKSLANNQIEYKTRTGKASEMVEVDGIVGFLQNALNTD
jgi:prolyl-tRNA synthetase